VGPGLLETVRFLWNATRGQRLRPWRSEYLRWRIETYTGKPSKDVKARDFMTLAWGERRQFLRFLTWTAEMRGYANGKGLD
jgi:hypothetical protein